MMRKYYLHPFISETGTEKLTNLSKVPNHICMSLFIKYSNMYFVK